MSLTIASINSGSNGNCYYIGNEDQGVFVDAGISCRETEKRMKRLALPIEKIKAIFVSHEHGDHITGIPALSKKYQIPVYITLPTLSNGRIPVEPHLIHSFKAHQPVQIGSLSITPFPKYHDAADPHSFLIQSKQLSVGVFTDIGKPCQQLIRYFKQCHAAFLEANYDTQMLEKGNYPYHLKKRIAGGEGHLSNEQALALFLSHRPPFMSHLLLAHLSKNNNHPQLVADMFAPHAGTTEVIVTSRYQESEAYRVTGQSHPVQPQMIRQQKKRPSQLNLFE
ncbi:MAG: MBL fold metallo-hydrolase [Bacteroidota bacterium]|nr:MBL fold metallo-hydrolase [Bacteroidota bacterium]